MSAPAVQRADEKTIPWKPPRLEAFNIWDDLLILLNVRKFNKKYCRMQVGAC